MKRVLLLLAEGFEALEAAVFSDVLGFASVEVEGAEPIEVVTAGRRPRLRCTFAFEVVPQLLLSQVNPSEYDALAIPGGFEAAGFYEDAFADDFVALIRAFADRGKPVAAVCVGALPVAKSGALAGRRATTYHLMGGLRRRQLAELGAEVVDAPLVRDGPFITSAGPATALDAAFALLEQLTSPEHVAATRHVMGFGQQPCPKL